MVGSFTGARTAAVARLTRGAPQVGWALTDGSGIAAPTWVAPNFPSLVGEVNSSLLDQLKAIVKGFASDQQVAQMISIALPAPANSSGQSMGGADDVDGRLDGSLPEPGAGIRDRLPAGGRWSSGPRRSARLHSDGAGNKGSTASRRRRTTPRSLRRRRPHRHHHRPPICSPRSSVRCGRSPPTATGARPCGSAGPVRPSPRFSAPRPWRRRAPASHPGAAERRLPADRNQSSRGPAGPGILSPQYGRPGNPDPVQPRRVPTHLRGRRPGHLWAMDAVDFGRPEPRSPTSSRFGS